MRLKINDMAPVFESTTETGEKFSLVDMLGKTNIVLYFYPKDFTMGCTKEACAFRDNWNKVISLGSTIIGVSSDSPETHSKFKKEHSLQFTLLSDENKDYQKTIRHRWQVHPAENYLHNRQTRKDPSHFQFTT